MQDGDEDIIHSEHDSDNDNQADLEANPLMVTLHGEEMPTQREITDKWFSQDIFAEAAAEDRDLGKYESEDETEEDREEQGLLIPKKSKENKVHKSSEVNPPKNQTSKAEEGFEIVPAPSTDSSDDSSSDESEDEDIETKAEILACAKKMLRKKERERILDDAYNKYMFHDKGLPEWFVDEEARHCQTIKPVTKEEMAAMRAQFKEIDARPAKKVAEAKARKKRATMKKLEKVRKKANTISDQTDISDRSKMKMIDQLYKKAAPKKPEKEYVVAKKGVQVRAGKGKVLVDRRMKKDARSRGMKKQGKGPPKKGGGSKKGKNSYGHKGKGGSSKASAKGGNGGKKGNRMSMHN